MKRFHDCLPLLAALGFTALCAPALAGCATYGTYGRYDPADYVGHHHEGEADDAHRQLWEAQRAADAAGAAVDTIGGIADLVQGSAEEQAQDAEDRADIASAYAQPPRVIPHQPAIVTAPDPAHVPFDAVAARSALAALDVSSCAAHGVPSGYVHAYVTFAKDGRASAVAIDAPADLPAPATACLNEALLAAAAPAYDGAPITVGANLLVR